MKEMMLAFKFSLVMTLITLGMLVWLMVSSSELTMELLISLLIMLPIAAPVLWLSFVLLEWPVRELMDALRQEDD